MAKYKSIIGRFELVNFPLQLLDSVPAKVDTGANISSVHATNIEEITKSGRKLLRFTLLEGHKSFDYSRQVEVGKYSTKKIENSFGHSEKRFMVRLKVKVANKTFYADFTLADRSKKSFPILLGREMLNNRFIVDTSINSINKKFLESRMPNVLKEDTEE